MGELIFFKKDKTKEIEKLLEKAASLMSLERYEEAIEALDKAIDINPNDAFALSSKGMILADLQRYKESIEAFDKARLIFKDKKNLNMYTKLAENEIKRVASLLLKKDCTNMSIEDILKEIKG